MSRTKCFFMIILMIPLCKSLELQSYFGKGYCLSESPILNKDIKGPRMCVAACSRNTQCITVNYVKDYLHCTFLSSDSNASRDFDTDPTCIHYRSKPLPSFQGNNTQQNSSDECGPCPPYSTCVTLRKGDSYCVTTGCPDPVVANGVVSPGMLEVGVTRQVTCDTDHELLDKSLTTSMVCLSDGRWNKDQPLICKLQECPEPTKPSNGMIVAGNNTIGSFRDVQCNPGYAQIGGGPNIECKSGKVWTSWTGTCSLCSQPAAISNALVTPGNVTVGSQRNYSCQTDYVDNGQPNTITCLNDATWSSTAFACALAECSEPTPPSNGAVLAGSNQVGSQRTIQCSTGYAMTGTSLTYIECQSGQTWSTWPGSCVTCSQPSPIANAGISAGTVTVGSTRTYSCNSGYDSNGQPATITCGNNAQWSSTSFSCVEVCPNPTPPANGNIASGSNAVGSTRTVQCNTGYARLGSQTTIQCQSNRVWTTWTGTCSTCSTPASISYASLSSGGVTVGSTRTYTCNTGYQSNGNSGTITCQNDATWSSTSFACSIVDCGTPPVRTATTRSYSSTTYNSVATYACEYGSNSNGGTTSSTCNSAGSWTSITLTCARYYAATFSFETTDTWVFDQTGAAYSWTKRTGPTDSVDTGPTGAYSGSYYMYFETSSPTVQGSRAAMQTRMWFRSLVRCVDFYYSMYGVDIGTLYVKYMYEGSSTKYTLWSRTGNRGTSTWYNVKIPVNLPQDFKLIFEATDGGANYYGDIAVDYIRVTSNTC